jgi:hypothetical protein
MQIIVFGEDAYYLTPLVNKTNAQSDMYAQKDLVFSEKRPKKHMHVYTK